MKIIQTQVWGRLQHTWRLARRSLIQIIAEQEWILFPIESTMNLNVSVMMSKKGFSMLILFVTQYLTMSLSTSIQFQSSQNEVAIWLIFRILAWNLHMPGALVADDMGIGKTFTAVVAALRCTLQTEMVVKWLSQSIWCGNTLEEWVSMAQKDNSGIIVEEWEWYPLQRWQSVPCYLQRSRHLHSTCIQGLPQPVNRSWRSQHPQRQRQSTLSSTRWDMEVSSNWRPCCTGKLRISPTTNWIPVLMSRKPIGISTKTIRI